MSAWGGRWGDRWGDRWGAVAAALSGHSSGLPARQISIRLPRPKPNKLPPPTPQPQAEKPRKRKKVRRKDKTTIPIPRVVFSSTYRLTRKPRKLYASGTIEIPVPRFDSEAAMSFDVEPSDPLPWILQLLEAPDVVRTET